MIYYIYRINFLLGEPKGRYYIGKHCCKNEWYFNWYAGSGKFCQRYYKKYGKIEGVTYTKDVLCICSSEKELSEKEREYVGNLYELDPLCMNLKGGGEGEPWNRGKKGVQKHSPETIEKQRKAHKGNQAVKGMHWVLSEETKEKMRKPKSEETKQKMSKAQKGRQFSEETRKRMSIAAKKRCTKERMSEISRSKKDKQKAWNKGMTKQEMEEYKKNKAA